MSGDVVAEIVRVGWLTLTFMMLLSRVVFQAKGAVWMRSFLDGWQRGGVKRAWGAAALAFAVFVAAAAATASPGLGVFDAVLTVTLVVVLAADGLVNVTQGGFAAFKDRMQRAWVSRRRGTGREGDRYLFATVNAALAVASAAVAAVVIVYRPISVSSVAIALGVAVALTTILVAAATRR
jgi:hypothetical protein